MDIRLHLDRRQFECWIALPWNTLRIAVLYGPVWLVIVVIFSIYTRVGLYIYSHLKNLRALGMTSDWTEDVNRMADSTNVGSRRSTELTRRLSSDSSMAAWAYARYSFLFFVALIITWVG